MEEIEIPSELGERMIEHGLAVEGDDGKLDLTGKGADVIREYLDAVKPNAIITSPSGWTYRESQENGDEVDCHNCGYPIGDDYPIANDENWFAYHEGCI